MIQLINKFKDRFFLDKNDSLIVQENKIAKRNNPSLPKKNVLIQMPEDYYYLALFSILVKSFRELFNSNISWININNEFQRRSLIRRNRFFERKWTQLYQSLGGKTALSHLLYDKELLKNYRAKAQAVLKKISSKEELVDFKYQEIQIGDLTYDTYLRYKPAPTVNLQDPFLTDVMISALYIFDNTTKYFEKNATDVLITSYCTYIHHGIPVRVALEKGIKVLSFGSYTEIVKTVSKEYPQHVKEYANYSKDFNSLSPVEKEEGLKLAKETLEFRFSGGVDSATSYMRKSAYIANDTKYLQDSPNPRVIFFLHCFFDSPHIYRNMIFPDFHEWLSQSFEYLKNLQIDVYVKQHPNAIEGNKEIVQQILAQYPFVKLLPPEANNKSLAQEGFDAAVTVYGTLIHEFNYLGIPVISCGDNPHVSYGFGSPAKTREEYFLKLKNITKLKQESEFNENDVFSFVYMHSLYYPKETRSKEMKDLHLKTLRPVITSKDAITAIQSEDAKKLQSLFENELKHRLTGNN